VRRKHENPYSIPSSHRKLIIPFVDLFAITVKILPPIMICLEEDMEQSENIAEISAAISKAQGEIRNPAKNTKNAFFKNEYADLTAVLNCIRPVASANGLAFMQGVEAYGDRVAVTSQITHSSGQWIRQVASVALSASSKNPIQDLGSISTYLKRYQSQSMWAICADEDTDAQDLTIGIENISDQKAAHIDAMIDSTKSSKAKFLEIYNVSDLKQLTEDQYDRAVKQLQTKKQKQVK
jgi:hypothetical protein